MVGCVVARREWAVGGFARVRVVGVGGVVETAGMVQHRQQAALGHELIEEGAGGAGGCGGW